MATPSPFSLPSEKLRIDFGWMLNDVADSLSKNDFEKVARAELPKSLWNLDSVGCDTTVTLLHTLAARGKFGPLDPDGLIEILKKLKNASAVEIVKQYKSEARYKQEKRRTKKKDKLQETSEPENIEEVEKLLATAKIESITHISTVMKALGVCESKVELYKANDINIEEVTESFVKFSGTLEKTKNTLRKALSGSSITSSSSSEGGNPVVNEFQASPHYENLPVHCPSSFPVQETGKHSESVFPKRYTKSTHFKQRERSNSLPTTRRKKIIEHLPSTEVDNDYTDGTGDSGVDSGESERSAWIKNSGIRQDASTFEMAAPPPDSNHYTPLIVRRKPQDVNEGEYTQPTRVLCRKKEFLDELNEKLRKD